MLDSLTVIGGMTVLIYHNFLQNIIHEWWALLNFGVYTANTDLATNLENLLGQNWFQGLISVLAVIVTIVIYMHEQKKLRRETIIRSCEAILREIEENLESLSGKNYQRISYSEKKQDDKTEEENVNYTNVYLDLDAYDSVLSSGAFTHFTSATQHKLTMVYSRIRKRNETITYIEHFEDAFFMNISDQTDDARERWFKTIKKYDILITRYETEIVQFLGTLKPMIEKEKLRQNMTI